MTKKYPMPCELFLKGNCQNGEKCQFLHDTKPQAFGPSKGPSSVGANSRLPPDISMDKVREAVELVSLLKDTGFLESVQSNGGQLPRDRYPQAQNRRIHVNGPQQNQNENNPQYRPRNNMYRGRGGYVTDQQQQQQQQQQQPQNRVRDPNYVQPRVQGRGVDFRPPYNQMENRNNNYRNNYNNNNNYPNYPNYPSNVHGGAATSDNGAYNNRDSYQNYNNNQGGNIPSGDDVEFDDVFDANLRGRPAPRTAQDAMDGNPGFACGLCGLPRIKKFGLLENCDHHFCFNCIKFHRYNQPADHRYDCPVCGIASNVLVASHEWPNSPRRKQEMITNFLRAQKQTNCKFGNSCRNRRTCFFCHPDELEAQDNNVFEGFA